MSNDTLQDFFQLQPDSTSDAGLNALFAYLAPATSSIDCYCKLFNLCMQVLAKKSMDFCRASGIATDSTDPNVPPKLEEVVATALSEDWAEGLMDEDEYLVLFEGASFIRPELQPRTATATYYQFKTDAKATKAYRAVQKMLGHDTTGAFPDTISSDQTTLLKLVADALLSSLPLVYKGKFKPAGNGNQQTGCKAKLTAPLFASDFSHGPAFTFRIWDPDDVEARAAAKTEAGTFYFEDTDTPSLVVTKVANDHRGYNKDAQMTADFEKWQIDGTEQTERTASGGTSKVKFFDLLRALTDWQGLNAVRTYRPYYQSVADKANEPIAHLRVQPPGGWGGTGIARADTMGIDDYLWFWQGCGNGIGDFSDLPKLLELPASREIKGITSLLAGKFVAIIKEESHSCSLEPKCLSDAGLNYWILTIETHGSYVLANTPHPSLAQLGGPTDPKHLKRAVVTGDILKIFDFCYFRKIDSNLVKVLKSVPKNSTRRPGTGDGVTITSGDPAKIGINLPVSFRINANVQRLAATKHDRLDLKNKASILHKAGGVRADAGGVMAQIVQLKALRPGFQDTLRESVTSINSKLPATAFTAAVIEHAQKSREDWQQVKATTRTKLTVNQEWCHLQGHGDGGDERLGNFVSGSFHCNTEQLAMEEALRETTQSAPPETYLLRSTAYLLMDDGSVITKDYLDEDSTYKNLLEKNKKIVARQLGTAAASDECQPPDKRPKPNLRPPLLPVAVFIRYKIIKKVDERNYQKVWDYIFEGQSEFFDRNMYRILSMTTRFALAGMEAFKKWYVDNTASTQDAAASSTGSRTGPPWTRQP